MIDEKTRSKITSAIFDLAGKITSRVKASCVGKPELRIKVPERIAHLTVPIEVHKNVPVNRKIPFPIPEIIRIDIHSLPFFIPQPQAIVRQPEGFELQIKKLDEGIKTVVLGIEYRIEDMGFLNSLVQTDVQSETSTDEREEYWMHAQLKHVDILDPEYRRLDILDLPLSVDVAVFQDLKTVIPHSLIRQLELASRLLSTTDRGQAFRLSLEHARLLRTRSARGAVDLLKEAERVFQSDEFVRFLEITTPFHYGNSIASGSLYNIPSLTFPKTMTVVSRTDLTMKEPAAKGKLTYKKKEFRGALTDIFGAGK